MYYLQYKYSLNRAPADFVALASSAYLAPFDIKPVRKKYLESQREIPEYLIITHQKFIEALEPLAALRRQQGLSTAIVDVEDIYNEFGDGKLSVDAIRTYVDHLLKKSRFSNKKTQISFLGRWSHLRLPVCKWSG